MGVRSARIIRYEEEPRSTDARLPQSETGIGLVARDEEVNPAIAGDAVKTRDARSVALELRRKLGDPRVEFLGRDLRGPCRRTLDQVGEAEAVLE